MHPVTVLMNLGLLCLLPLSVRAAMSVGDGSARARSWVLAVAVSMLLVAAHVALVALLLAVGESSGVDVQRAALKLDALLPWYAQAVLVWMASTCVTSGSIWAVYRTRWSNGMVVGVALPPLLGLNWFLAVVATSTAMLAVEAGPTGWAALMVVPPLTVAFAIFVIRRRRRWEKLSAQ